MCLQVPSSVQADKSYTGQSDTDVPLDDLSDDEESNLTAIKCSDPTTEGRIYSYSDMMDLQSRLMLVSGKTDAGRESIEKFTAVNMIFFHRN